MTSDGHTAEFRLHFYEDLAELMNETEHDDVAFADICSYVSYCRHNSDVRDFSMFTERTNKMLSNIRGTKSYKRMKKCLELYIPNLYE